MYVWNQEQLREGRYAETDIERIIFGPNVSYIPENCFNGCNNLKEIVFEGNIDNIEAAAFMGCKNLNIVDFNIVNNVNIIEDFAFYGCNNIYNFNINEDVAADIKYGKNNDGLSTYFVLPEIGTPLNNIPWYKIDLISRKGKAKEYFKVGEEKEIIINNYNYEKYDFKTKGMILSTHPKTTYNVQILGFDHDYSKIGYDFTYFSKKNGITFGLKDQMVSTYNMNANNSNIKGWNTSEMRLYLKNKVFPSLSPDLQLVIKTTYKRTDCDQLNNIVKDKLFLFSSEEVGINLTSDYIQGQGTKYEFFSNNASRIKYRNGSKADYWLRSILTSNTKSFYYINSNGIDNYQNSCISNGIVFGFCI